MRDIYLVQAPKFSAAHEFIVQQTLWELALTQGIETIFLKDHDPFKRGIVERAQELHKSGFTLTFHPLSYDSLTRHAAQSSFALTRDDRTELMSQTDTFVVYRAILHPDLRIEYSQANTSNNPLREIINFHKKQASVASEL